jgi:hypothetical protein
MDAPAERARSIVAAVAAPANASEIPLACRTPSRSKNVGPTSAGASRLPAEPRRW